MQALTQTRHTRDPHTRPDLHMRPAHATRTRGPHTRPDATRTQHLHIAQNLISGFPWRHRARSSFVIGRSTPVLMGRTHPRKVRRSCPTSRHPVREPQHGTRCATRRSSQSPNGRGRSYEGHLMAERSVGAVCGFAPTPHETHGCWIAWYGALGMVRCQLCVASARCVPVRHRSTGQDGCCWMAQVGWSSAGALHAGGWI